MDINSSTELATAVTSNVAIRTAAQLEIFGPPPLLEGESQQAYDTLLAATRRRRYPGSVLGDVVNNSVLVINRSNAYEYDGVISGTGALQPHRRRHHHALGQQHLYRRHHGQRRHVAGERLDRSRRRYGDQRRHVGGTGTLGPVTVIGGTLAPGNSIGTITVGGNLTFGAGSTYQVEVSPAASDRTNVTGTRLARRHRAGDPACRQLPRPDLHHPQCRRRRQRHVRQSDHHRYVRAGRAQSASDLRRQQRLPGARSERADAAAVRQCERSISARWRTPSTRRSLPAQRRRPRSTCCSTSAARRR